MKRSNKFIAIRICLAFVAAIVVIGMEPALEKHEAERDMRHVIHSAEADAEKAFVAFLQQKV